MELKKFNIQLDIKKRNYNEVFQVVQGDYETNVLEIQLLDDAVKYNLTDLSVEIAFRKADGTTVLQTSDTGVIITSTTEGKLECTLKTNTIAAIGRVIAEVRVLGANDKLLTSTTFDFIVRESLVNDGTIESTNEFPVLTGLIGTVNGLIDDVSQIEQQVPENILTSIGNLSSLTTTNKTSIVSAVNEINGNKVSQEDYAGLVTRVEDLEVSDIFRYGIKINKTDSNPDTRVEYLYDAIGMTPAYMDYTSGEFNYGAWRKFAEWVNKPVMLNYDGTVAYDLDRNDQTKKADGTPSDISNTAFGGNAMSQFKLLWLYQYEDATHEYIIFSNIKYDDNYKAWAFTDKDGNVNEFMYRSMFDGSFVSPRLRSLATGAVMASQTGQTEITRAEASGAGWNISYKSQRDFITYLLWLISKSTNTQVKFGEGNSNSVTYISPGALKDKGQFMGYNTETQAVKVFYIEHYWGNYWERVAGHIMDLDGQVFTKMTPPYPQPALPDQNVMPEGYTPTGIIPSGTSGSYINTVTVTNDTGFVPKTTGGSATQYYCDGMWYSIGTTIKWALVGGNRGSGGRCGGSTVFLDVPLSDAASSIGAALSFLENAS